jgi:hypothetical protein
VGPCTSASAVAASYPFIIVNEVTTVGAVWALQQFMSAPSGVAGSVSVGAPTTNLVGLQNAFTTAANIVDISAGQPNAANSSIIPEADRIDTLADIISYCVNSTTTTSACSSMFTSATPSSSSLSTKGVLASTLNVPADTVQAVWYLAQFPTNIGGAGSCGTAAAAFACIQGTGAPFTAMTTAPNDWTLAVAYAPVSGGNSAIALPFWVAMDFFGNAWLTNTTSSDQSVVAIGPNASVLMAPAVSYTVGALSGYAATLASSGVTVTTAPSYVKAISHPREIAIDSGGNAWLADWNSSITSNETQITGSSYTCASGNTCYFGTVAEFPAATGPGTSITGSPMGYYSGTLPYAATADASGNVYFTLAGGSTNPGSKVLGKFNSSGAYTVGAGIGTHPYAVVIDNTPVTTSTSSTTAAINAPLIWVNDQSGCTATGGGDAAVVLQILSGSQIASSNSGLTGANTGCTSSVHDVIAANTGTITGVAVDALNNLWLVNSSTEQGSTTSPGTTGALNTVTYGVRTIASSKAIISTAASTGSVSSAAGAGGLSNPQYVAVDGANNAWISNFTAPSVSEFSISNVGATGMAINALSGTSGYTHSETNSTINGGEGIAIDLSGNVWVANYGGSKYVTVLVGAATPVAPVIPGNLGVAP